MSILLHKLNIFFRKKSVKYGVPFLILVVGGSFGLEKFTQLKYTFRQEPAVDPKELEKLGVEMKKPGEITLESEYDKIKQLDIDNWSQVRGPRPWEENIN